MPLAQLCAGRPAAQRQHRGQPAAATDRRAAGRHRVRPLDRRRRDPPGPVGDRAELGDPGRSAGHQHTTCARWRLPGTADRRRPRRAAARRSSRSGCAATSDRLGACGPACRRAGPPQTRPAAATTAAPTTSGSPTGPTGQRLLLSIMTRSQADDPKADELQPLIADVTTLVVPYLTQPQSSQASSGAGSVNGSPRSAATCSDSSAPSCGRKPLRQCRVRRAGGLPTLVGQLEHVRHGGVGQREGRRPRHGARHVGHAVEHGVVHGEGGVVVRGRARVLEAAALVDRDVDQHRARLHLRDSRIGHQLGCLGAGDQHRADHQVGLLDGVPPDRSVDE